ncbi:MAG: hypothetical protein V4694_02095 [Pseudomonadota bacterium]
MIISAILALLLPFELFLISYAILGPLHYLTEIFWLHKKQYFVPRKKDYFLLLTVSIIIAALVLLINLWPLFKDLTSVENFFNAGKLDKNEFQNEIYSWAPALIFLAFATAFIATFVKDWWFRTNAFVVTIILLLIFKGTWTYSVIFGVLLTTIIHVWLFTGIFILSGAIRNKALASYISFTVFCIISASFLFISQSNYIAGKYAVEIFQGGNFGLNEIIFRIFNIPFQQQDLIYSNIGIKIQAFLAFAYTYHYLNWFSKVEIIKWNQVPKKFLIASGTMWLASIALYLYDYKTGFYFLLFLSMMHVFLEFPLNFHSIRSVFGKGKI